MSPEVFTFIVSLGNRVTDVESNPQPYQTGRGLLFYTLHY